MDVKEIISNRLKGQRDNFHLGLSIEGGVMRGSVSAGMVEAIHELGLEDIFDSFWGSSIGSINAAYLAAGDTACRSDLYAQAASSQNFYRDKVHPVHGLIDLDWLFHFGMDHLQPLPFEKLINSKLRFLVTKAGWGRCDEAVFRYMPSTKDDYRDLLKGACRAPIIAGLPIKELRGGLWDGGVFEAWPMRTPFEKEVTHMVVLRSRPKEPQPSVVEDYLMPFFNYLFVTPSYKEQEEKLKSLEKDGLALAVYPKKDLVDRGEKDPEQIRNAYQESKKDFNDFWWEEFSQTAEANPYQLAF